VRIVAVLSWYDEPVDWLHGCVTSARFCDHLIAADGPYAAFPHEMPYSSPDQSEAIRGAWPGCTIHTRPAPWAGEVEKRDFLFGLAVAEGADWIFVIDADEVVVGVPSNLRDLLDATQLHVAEATLMYEQTPGWPLVPSQVRRLFRVLPGIGYRGAHSRVVAEVGGGQVALTDPDLSVCEPAERIGDLRMLHRSHERSPGRQSQKADYYKLLPTLEK
jgi:hypothetical protein